MTFPITQLDDSGMKRGDSSSEASIDTTKVAAADEADEEESSSVIIDEFEYHYKEEHDEAPAQQQHQSTTESVSTASATPPPLLPPRHDSPALIEWVEMSAEAVPLGDTAANNDLFDVVMLTAADSDQAPPVDLIPVLANRKTCSTTSNEIDRQHAIHQVDRSSVDGNSTPRIRALLT